MRRSLACAFLVCLFAVLSIGLERARSDVEQSLPIAGQADPNLAVLDRMMIDFMKKHKIRGATMAVAKDGRLVYARGFGYADLKRHEAMQTNSLMRIASVSKPVTAAAILLLVQQGKLKLTDSVWELLRSLQTDDPGAERDPRWKKVTVLHLLQHTGGWDRDKSFDPMFSARKIAKALDIALPPSANDVIRYMLGKPLDFEPGERYAYSNFGYCMLGRIVEKVSGQAYDQFVEQQVLAPLGIHDMRVGKTLAKDRLPREVTYSLLKDRIGTAVVGPEIGKQVPAPYGVWYLESLDALGGWVASAPDLVRFATALDRPGPRSIFNAETLETVFERPKGNPGFQKDGKPKAVYYGCGWRVRVINPEKKNTWHAGYYAGTESLLVRRWDGLTYAVLFNTSDGGKLSDYLDPLVHKALDQVKIWPAKDLFKTASK